MLQNTDLRDRKMHITTKKYFIYFPHYLLAVSQAQLPVWGGHEMSYFKIYSNAPGKVNAVGREVSLASG